MKYLLLSLLLLTGCKDLLFGGDQHLSTGEDVTVSSGYEAANIDNTMYTTLDLSTGSHPAQADMDSMGQACKMWAGVIPKNTTLVTNGNPVVNHHFKFKVLIRSVEQTNKDCADLSGVKDAIACTEHLDNGCRAHLAVEHNDAIWAWECAACFNKDFN